MNESGSDDSKYLTILGLAKGLLDLTGLDLKAKLGNNISKLVTRLRKGCWDL